MQRKRALVVAGTVAFLGATGIVATAAVTGANILGFHVASPFKASAAEGATTSTTDTEAAGPATTPAPVYVVTTVFYDQVIVVPTAKADPTEAAAPTADAYAPAAGPQAAAAYAAPVAPEAGPAAGPAAAPPAPATSDPVPPPPVTPAPPTVRTTPAPSAPAPTPAPAVAPAAITTTTTRPPTTATTLFDPNGPVPANLSVPANLKVAASQTALPPGGPFTTCQFEDDHTWNCEK